MKNQSRDAVNSENEFWVGLDVEKLIKSHELYNIHRLIMLNFKIEVLKTKMLSIIKRK